MIFVISWYSVSSYVPAKRPGGGYTSNLLLAKKWRTRENAQRYLDLKDPGYASGCTIHQVDTTESLSEILARLDAKALGSATPIDIFQFLYAADLSDVDYGVLVRTVLGIWNSLPLGLSREEAAMTFAAVCSNHQIYYPVLRECVLQLTKVFFEAQALPSVRSASWQPTLRQVQVFELVNPMARKERAFERREITEAQFKYAPRRGEIDYLLSPKQLEGTSLDELRGATLQITGIDPIIETHETEGGEVVRFRIPFYRLGDARKGA